MVLMNASSKARHASSIVNKDTKGGNKKAGLPGLIGRTAGESIAQTLPELEYAPQPHKLYH